MIENRHAIAASAPSIVRPPLSAESAERNSEGDAQHPLQILLNEMKPLDSDIAKITSEQFWEMFERF